VDSPRRDFVLLVALAESPQVCVGGVCACVCVRERDYVLLVAVAESPWVCAGVCVSGLVCVCGCV